MTAWANRAGKGAILLLAASLWGATDLRNPRTRGKEIPAQLGRQPVMLFVADAESSATALEIRDSAVLVLRALQDDSPLPFDREDTLIGPLVLLRPKRGKPWRIPDGTSWHVERKYPADPILPPLAVCASLLCHPGIVRMANAGGDSTLWDSLSYRLDRTLRCGRLLAPWRREIHELAMVLERDSGQCVREGSFAAPPRRLFLWPRIAAEPEAALEEMAWLDSAGNPLLHPLEIPPASAGHRRLRARLGELDALVEIVLGGTDEVQLLYHKMATNGRLDSVPAYPVPCSWCNPTAPIDPARHPLPDGWRLLPVVTEFVNPTGSHFYRHAPRGLRWRHGKRIWAPVPEDRLYSFLPLDSTPPHQDPNHQWTVSPDPFADRKPFVLSGFGTACWSGRFRWRSPDSLVAWANVACSGMARKAFGRDSVTVEIPVHWAPGDTVHEFVPDTSVYRTLPCMGMAWFHGRIYAGKEPFFLERSPDGWNLLQHASPRDTTGGSSDLVVSRPGKPPAQLKDRVVESDFSLHLGAVGVLPFWVLVKEPEGRFPPRWPRRFPPGSTSPDGGEPD